MTYKVQILPVAVRSIRRLSPEAKRRLQAVIELLATEPRPPGARRLRGRPEWRVRAGDYRVIYRVHDDVLTVVVVAAGHRSSVYRKIVR